MAQEVGKRAQGAILGAFIGDALALGPHWYYDLDALRRDYGPWIHDYTDPRPAHPDRSHRGRHDHRLKLAAKVATRVSA